MRRYVPRAMSAAEIIELIKKLPPDERAEVVAFVKENEASGLRYLPQAEAERRAKRIFRENE